MTTIDPPTEDERAALELYAATHGRYWKRRLLDDWTNGRTVGELQRIRNSRGPSWLLQHYTPRKGSAK